MATYNEKNSPLCLFQRETPQWPVSPHCSCNWPATSSKSGCLVMPLAKTRGTFCQKGSDHTLTCLTTPFQSGTVILMPNHANSHPHQSGYSICNCSSVAPQLLAEASKET